MRPIPAEGEAVEARPQVSALRRRHVRMRAIRQMRREIDIMNKVIMMRPFKLTRRPFRIGMIKLSATI